MMSFSFQPRESPVKCKAAVPFETAQENLEPKYLFRSFSNFSTAFPWVSQSPFNTFTTESISP